MRLEKGRGWLLLYSFASSLRSTVAAHLMSSAFSSIYLSNIFISIINIDIIDILFLFILHLFEYYVTILIVVISSKPSGWNSNWFFWHRESIGMHETQLRFVDWWSTLCILIDVWTAHFLLLESLCSASSYQLGNAALRNACAVSLQAGIVACALDAYHSAA